MLSTELLTFYRQLHNQTFTVVDVETTGRDVTSDRVMELSVLQATLRDGIQQQKTDLINPQTLIPANIVKFTRISQAMVEVAPIAAEVLPDYLSLLSTGVLTAHNLEFDYPFLQAEYGRLGIDYVHPEAQQLCTVQLSRLMLPDLRSRRLPKLVKHFKFNVGRSHRAEADTLACWFLLERLMTEILNEPDEVLLSRFAKQWMPLTDAAKLLGCSPQEAQILLSAADVSCRLVGRKKQGTWMYQRGGVEQVFDQQQRETQLTCKEN